MVNAYRPMSTAVVVIAVALLASACGGGAVDSSPTSRISPVPAARPSDASSVAGLQTPAQLPSTGALDAGAYYIPAGPTTPARLTLTVPSGWTTDQGFVFKNRGSLGEVLVVTWIVSHVYTDVCHWQGNLQAAGTSVDELANALQAQKGRTASAPTDLLVGSFPAKRVELTVPANLDLATCNEAKLRFWPDPGPDESGGLCCAAVGSTDVVYVVNVAGKRLAIVARHQPGTSAQDLAELERVVASIKIDPAVAAPLSPSPTPSQ